MNLRQGHYLGGPNIISLRSIEEESFLQLETEEVWRGRELMWGWFSIAVLEGAKGQGSESGLWKLRGLPPNSQQANGDFGPIIAKNWIQVIPEMDLEEDPEFQMRTQLINTFISVL